MFADPSKLTPAIVLAVVRVSADPATMPIAEPLSFLLNNLQLLVRIANSPVARSLALGSLPLALFNRI